MANTDCDAVGHERRAPLGDALHGYILIALLIVAFIGCGGGGGSQSASGTLIRSDEFNAAAGTGVDTEKWLYDIGTGYPGGPPNWGTGEVEFMTDDTANVYHDGKGHLAIKPLRGSGTPEWTSGRIETQRSDFDLRQAVC